MARRRTAALLAAILATIASAPASAATSMPFVGWSHDAFGIGNKPSGAARFHGLGHGTETFTVVVAEPAGACLRVVTDTTFTFANGTIHSIDDVLLCQPGGSGGAPGSTHSTGVPFRVTGTFDIVGGTGDYAGASGGGDVTATLAGNSLVGRYDGTLHLP